VIRLYPYQDDLVRKTRAAWAGGAQNVCAVLPTGGGKTVVFTYVIGEEPGVAFSLVHRQELVGQIAMAHAAAGISHSIQAPKKVIQWITTQQTRKYGRHWYDPNANKIVCSVQTLLNRASSLSNALGQARLWVGDEFHHFLRANQWGKAVALFPPTCRGLGVTATPERADGRGIGRHARGVADAMVVGPGMRQLIQAGYLTDYKIFGPYTDINLSNVPVSSATGDYTKPKLTAAVRKSHIVGDVVQSYLEIAPGKIGVTFVTDVPSGIELAAAYVAAGVPARVVHAKTPDRERQESTDMLARGDLKQLVNVDIFGEGYDLPAIEVISMARPTESYPLYAQQFGRSLRIMDGKTHALIIDHVRNVERHGLPDSHREWSLDSRDRAARSKRDPNLIPIRTCRNCTSVYESWQHDCPYCGWVYAPVATASIEQVEGDITELTPEVLAIMRGEIERVDMNPESERERLTLAGAPPIGVLAGVKRHRDRQAAQVRLRQTMSEWAGYQSAAGQHSGTVLRRFYKSFGIDVMAAQALSKRGATKLTERLVGAIR